MSAAALGMKIIHTSNYLKRHELTETFDKLKQCHFKRGVVKIYGREHSQPREQILFADEKITYKFGGTTYESKDMPQYLIDLYDRTMHTAEFKKPTNTIRVALINKYKDGSEYIAWHRDNEPEMHVGAPIVSLSFGQTRTFKVRLKQDPYITYRYLLKSGDLAILPYVMNQLWEHTIIKQSIRKVREMRISITFRTFDRQKK